MLEDIFILKYKSRNVEGFVDLLVYVIGNRKHRLLCCYVLERYLEGFSDSPIAVCRECISPKRSECWTIKMWWVAAKCLKRYGWKTKNYWLKLRKHPKPCVQTRKHYICQYAGWWFGHPVEKLFVKMGIIFPNIKGLNNTHTFLKPPN